MRPKSSTSREQHVTPYVFCACGCGQKTLLATSNHNKLGYTPGQPLRFLNGHNAAVREHPPAPPKAKPNRQQFLRLCDCGCQQPTLLASKTNKRSGAIKGQPLRFIDGHHGHREQHHNWKGGRVGHPTGYIRVLAPGHPTAGKFGYVFEHRLVAEAMLGRFLLPGEEIHHINGIRSDNREVNLRVTASHAAHMHLHAKVRWSRKYDACIDCGTTTLRHFGQGRCSHCYGMHKRAR